MVSEIGKSLEPPPFPHSLNVQESEAEFARVISYLPVMAWYCRVDRCRAVVSASFTRFTGRVFRDGSWRECMHPDDVDRLNGLDAFEAFAEGHIVREVRVLREDGTYHWHEVRGAPVYEESTGTVVGWMFTATDMEPKLSYERDRAVTHETLRGSEQRLKLATETARIGVFDSDLVTDRIVWSGSMEQIAALPPSEFPKTRTEAYGYVHPDDRPHVEDSFERAIRSGENDFSYEFRGVRRSGEVRFMTVHARLIRDASGAAVRAIGTMMDVTEAQNARAAMSEAKQRLQATYDNAGVGIAEIGRAGLLLKVNDTWKTFTGLSEEDLIGKAFWDVMPNEIERGDARAKFAQLVAGEIDTFDALREGVRHDGGRYWFDTKTTAVRDENGAFLYAVRIKRDITDSYTAHEQERLLLAELTHRVKNTIATIQAISSQTIGTATSLEAFHQNFLARLHSISATHALLIEKGWIGLSFEELLSTELRLYKDVEPSRWRIEGPSFEINPSAAVNIGLLMHELFSNARRFGAFSNPDGEIDVVWQIMTRSDEEECLRILWTERGGPIIGRSNKKGFGTRLLTSFTRQLSGSFLPVYAEAGLTAELVIPTSTIRLHPDAGLMKL